MNSFVTHSISQGCMLFLLGLLDNIKKNIDSFWHIFNFSLPVMKDRRLVLQTFSLFYILLSFC